MCSGGRNKRARLPVCMDWSCACITKSQLRESIVPGRIWWAATDPLLTCDRMCTCSHPGPQNRETAQQRNNNRATDNFVHVVMLFCHCTIRDSLVVHFSGNGHWMNGQSACPSLVCQCGSSARSISTTAKLGSIMKALPVLRTATVSATMPTKAYRNTPLTWETRQPEAEEHSSKDRGARVMET